MNMKEARNKAGLTQEQLAEAVGVDRTMITKVELGKANPSVKLAKKIAKELNINWTEFFPD